MPDQEKWVSRCLVALIDLNPDGTLDGTDWEDIAYDLWHDGAGAMLPEDAAFAKSAKMAAA